MSNADRKNSIKLAKLLLFVNINEIWRSDFTGRQPDDKGAPNPNHTGNSD